MTGIWAPSTTVFAGEELQTDGDGTAESIQLHEPYSICKFFHVGDVSEFNSFSFSCLWIERNSVVVVKSIVIAFCSRTNVDVVYTVHG